MINTVLSVIGASESNRATEAAMRSQYRASLAKIDQVTDQTAQQKQIRERQAHQIRSRLRVAAGESGAGNGGSAQAISRQVDFDLNRNLNILDTNFDNQVALIASGYEANMINLQSQWQNPFIAGIMGTMQDVQTTLNIASLGIDMFGGEGDDE